MVRHGLVVCSFFLGASTSATAALNCDLSLERTTVEEVQKMITHCAPLTTTSILKNQFVSLDDSLQIDTGAPQITSQRFDQVKIKAEGKSSISIDTSVHLNEYDDWTGNWKISVFSKSAEIPKSVQYISSLRIPFNDQTGKTLVFNFKSERGFVQPPQAVQKSPGCGGLRDCTRIRSFQINFDVLKRNGFHEEKTSYQIVFSPDIPPYISDWSDKTPVITNALKVCSLSWSEIPGHSAGQYASVNRCREVKDFHFGSN